MRYYSGKNRIGTTIEKELVKIKEQHTNVNFEGYLEPFCGSLGVFKHMTKHFDKCFATDGNEDIIMLWNAVKDKTFEEPFMTKELYRDLKKTIAPSALKAYAGFACSFLGTWFGSYIEEDDHKRYQSVMKNHSQIQNAQFDSKCYQELESKVAAGNYFIYCDPPYKNTTCAFGPIKDTKKNTKFDSEEFWIIMERWRSYGNVVVVSEFNAPANWTCVWSKIRSKKVNNSKTKSKSPTDNKVFEEKLFV